MIAKRPYDPVKLARGPKVGAVVVNLATREVELLQDFDDIPDMLLALRASSSIPIVAGPPIEYKGKLMTDGGVIEAVPYKAALQNGATHVLALRSSGEDYRKLPEREATLRLIQRHRWGGKVLAELVRERPRAYNEDAENLQAGRMYPNVLQIALAGEQRPVERLTKLELEVKNGVQLGVDAMGEALGTPRLYVTWNEDKPVILTNPEATY
jgi:predicted patatin/cPLA2 family phospholipase